MESPAKSADLCATRDDLVITRQYPFMSSPHSENKTKHESEQREKLGNGPQRSRTQQRERRSLQAFKTRLDTE
jgi:hypothetical protein